MILKRITYGIVFILLSSCASKKKVSDRDMNVANEPVKQKQVPVTRVTRGQIENVDVDHPWQFIVLISVKLPIAEDGVSQSFIVEQIQQTDNQILVNTDDLLLVQSTQFDDETGEIVATFKTEYQFVDGKLTQGPVLLNPETMTESNL